MSHPNAVHLIEVGQDEQHWQEKEKLARQRQEHTHFCLAYTLEEASTHHLYAHNREYKHSDAYGALGYLNQGLIGGEESCALIGQGLCYYPSKCCDAESYERLIPIEGTPVDMLNPPEGCPFAPRCEHAMKVCLQKMPPYVELGDNHRAACWLRVQDAIDAQKEAQKKEGTEGKENE